jgi:iron complex outermembrane receptor protein/outer membrane receptor for ferrienterochelin and colicins
MVVTATGFAQERREAPATISVVGEKELNTRSNQNVTEALREMPGVLVGNGNGSLATGDVQMRGMDSTYTSYMVNGIKQGTRESRLTATISAPKRHSCHRLRLSNVSR